jgi:hypothetical protein
MSESWLWLAGDASADEDSDHDIRDDVVHDMYNRAYAVARMHGWHVIQEDLIPLTYKENAKIAYYAPLTRTGEFFNPHSALITAFYIYVKSDMSGFVVKCEGESIYEYAWVD